MTNYLSDSNIQVIVNKQEDMEYHSHWFFELVYITGGKGIHYLDGETMTVREGDYFIIDYGSRHKYKTFGKTEFELINCLFLPELIDPSLRRCESFSELLDNYLIRFGSATLRCAPTKCIFKDADGSIRKIIMSMLEEYTNRKKGADEIMRCRLVEILILTMRKITDSSVAVSDNVISAITEYAENSCESQPRLSEIAQRLGMSAQYLSMKFKKAVGMTFTEYVQKVRIGQSCRLLAVTDKKITEIAELSGYGDIKFFNSVFKKHMHMTPREFRQSVKSAGTAGDVRY